MRTPEQETASKVPGNNYQPAGSKPEEASPTSPDMARRNATVTSFGRVVKPPDRYQAKW